MSEKRRPGIQAHIIKATEPVIKAETPTQLSQKEDASASEWIEPPADMKGFKAMVTHSSILPQCIRAYKNNIAGFGIGVRYKEDAEETADMAAEFERATEIIELLNMDMDTKELFEDVIESRETYGIAYTEVLRNVASGEITGLEFIKDTPTVRKTIDLDPYIDVAYNFKGRVEYRPKRFCKYKQTIGSKTVYFREIGDPRVMDKRNGEYLKDGEALEPEYHANEILEFAIGTEPYGEVRWLGQVLGIAGSRQAEELNKNYFDNGRHTPLMIMVKGGTLTEESFSKLQDYVNGIKGAAGQHAFLLLEVEDTDNKTVFTEGKPPEIEIKDLASILQKDELFQEYLENHRRKVQSAFQLPDLYVGYTTDFNRATAQTAQEVTEKQVFQPERRSLAWAINNKLLNGYGLKYVEAYFLEPDITNPDDLAKILNITERAGGLTPNKAKDITYSIMGDTAEPYEGEWGDIPLAYTKSMTASTGSPILQTLGNQITKAEGANDMEIVAVLKEVRRLLEKQEVAG